jgi:uncharacterized protein (TIGR03435 family)
MSLELSRTYPVFFFYRCAFQVTLVLEEMMRPTAMRFVCGLAVIVAAAMPGFGAQTQPEQKLSFEVAAIKPTSPDERARYIRMQGAHEFIAKSYTLKYLVSAGYNLTPKAISGGPDWTDVERYDILAATPGETRPSLDEQMAMVRTLLVDRFNLKFHTEPKEFPVYVLTVARGGSKLKESAAPDEQPVLVNTVYPGQKIVLPARNATMAQFASMLQRAVLDRPVIDKTNLSAKYDFDLEWTPDDTQFGGNLPPVPPENVVKPDLFAALQQLGLRLESSRAPIDTIVIDSVQRPSEN